jgi:hypothetical protein
MHPGIAPRHSSSSTSWHFSGSRLWTMSLPLSHACQIQVQTCPVSGQREATPRSAIAPPTKIRLFAFSGRWISRRYSTPPIESALEIRVKLRLGRIGEVKSRRLGTRRSSTSIMRLAAYLTCTNLQFCRLTKAGDIYMKEMVPQQSNASADTWVKGKKCGLKKISGAAHRWHCPASSPHSRGSPFPTLPRKRTPVGGIKTKRRANGYRTKVQG